MHRKTPLALVWTRNWPYQYHTVCYVTVWQMMYIHKHNNNMLYTLWTWLSSSQSQWHGMAWHKLTRHSAIDIMAWHMPLEWLTRFRSTTVATLSIHSEVSFKMLDLVWLPYLIWCDSTKASFHIIIISIWISTQLLLKSSLTLTYKTLKPLPAFLLSSS